jgi:ankyrin repeat protein
MWVWAKEEQVNSKELKNKLFLDKDKSGNTAWHRAAKGGSLMALELLWSWAKEVQMNTHELLLAQIEEGKNSWTLAAQKGDREKLEKMWVWAKEVQLNSRTVRKMILLGKDTYGQTAWHKAALFGRLEALEIIWSSCKKAGINTDELWLDKTWGGYNAFHLAVVKKHVEIKHKMVEWLVETHYNLGEIWKNLNPTKKTIVACSGTEQQNEII